MPPIRLEKPSCTQTAISVEVKKEICEYIVANPNVNQEREKWLAVLSTSQTPHIFCHHSVQFPELDKAMQIWTSQATAAGLPLTDMILQQKGKEFAKMLNIEDQLKCTNGWVYSMDEIRYFVEWLHHLDNWFRVMDRKILLLIDNAESHFNPKTFDEDSSDLSEDNEENVAENKLNIKEAIDYIAEAWEDVTPTTIQNCWKKIGILPASDFLVDDSNMQDFEIDESDELDGINIDCLPENENDESDDDDSDEEILLVSEKQGVDALKIFINYFEQQNDPEFNIDDLRIFRKYLRIARIKEINSKKQSTLDMFLL
ncbi:unnamed protein product [Rhizophagus irregularis]|nr:unnamed protein product [Rhizophagus irregularis]